MHQVLPQGVAGRKRPPTTWKRRFPLHNNHLRRNQQFVSKGNEKHDEPQGAESSDHYEENYSTPDSELPVSSPKKSCPSFPIK